jgi:hypothetical protein
VNHQDEVRSGSLPDLYGKPMTCAKDQEKFGIYQVRNLSPAENRIGQIQDVKKES